MSGLLLDERLDLAAFERVVRGHETVTLSEAARERIDRGRDYVESLLRDGRPVYGVNTGFGKFQQVRVGAHQLLELQRNLVLSHAIGVGPPFEPEVVRGILLLRAQSLAYGNSGVRPEVVELLLEFLNRQIHPVIPSQGSVGASGDLAPLAHLTLALIGEGEVEHRGEVRESASLLQEQGLTPLTLAAKEGLALINGTQAMASLLALVALDARTLLSTADVALAMSVEALKGSHQPFDPAVVRLRPYPGASEVADNLGRLLGESEINASHADCPKVQDAYSLRAALQVHGAIRDALRHVSDMLAVELNSVTDNPLLFPEEGHFISAGNFHGEPLALTADYAAIALAELANISERRVEQMLNPALSGLPAFLAEQGGLNSGLMVSQYTAAALVSENKVLAHPASVDSIPTSANQEDHVSMGTIACRKARQIAENTSWVLAIELASAAQALEFHRPLRPSRAVNAVYEHIREEVPYLERDRYFKPALERLRALVISGELLRTAASVTGELR
jgi:histidine ammonia-lyase